MNLDFDTIEIPKKNSIEQFKTTLKKVHGIHRKQMNSPSPQDYFVCLLFSSA